MNVRTMATAGRRGHVPVAANRANIAIYDIICRGLPVQAYTVTEDPDCTVCRRMIGVSLDLFAKHIAPRKEAHHPVL